MNKIGLFGGTFDPIHQGHLNIASAFLQQLALDSVIFLPAGDPYHKISSGTPAAQRLAMVELAIAGYPDFAVSDCDMVRDGPTYTYDTIQVFRQHFPNSELYWLLGMDSLMQLHTWKRWQDWVRQVHIVVAARAGVRLADTPQALHSWLKQAMADGTFHLLDTPLYPFSSSEIRDQLRRQQPHEGVPAAVYRYIVRNHLYQAA